MEILIKLYLVIASEHDEFSDGVHCAAKFGWLVSSAPWGYVSSPPANTTPVNRSAQRSPLFGTLLR